MFLVASDGFAQTRPATGVEAQPVLQRGRPTTAGEAAGVSWPRLAIALLVVLGLIMALRYVALFLFPSARSGGGGRGVRVLSRSPIAPRQQVLLLHVGRRVLVVGDSAGTLSPLASIEEPDEVAELIGQVSNATPAGAASKFKAMFGRAETQYDEDSPETMTAEDDPDNNVVADPRISQAENDISGLLSRMRTLTKTAKR